MSGIADPDKGGLTNDEGEKVGTDKNNPDSDGDGLTDGEETKTTFISSVNPGADGDGFPDEEEVRTTKTDPLRRIPTAGREGRGGGGARDEPLDAKGDVPKAEIMKVGASLTLEGITSATGNAIIPLGPEETLEKVYNGRADSPEAANEISGHTDNTGKKSANMKLLQPRGDAVQAWLVAKGIDSSQITTKGDGPGEPIAPNRMPEGRSKNRRIDIERSKQPDFL